MKRSIGSRVMADQLKTMFEAARKKAARPRPKADAGEEPGAEVVISVIAGEGFVVDGDSSQRERKDRTPVGTLISSIASSPYRNLSAGAPAVVAAGAAGDVRTARVRPSCTQGCSGAIDVGIGDAVQPEGHQSQHRLELDSVKPPPTSATDGGNLIRVSLHHSTSCLQTAHTTVLWGLSGFGCSRRTVNNYGRPSPCTCTC